MAPGERADLWRNEADDSDDTVAVTAGEELSVCSERRYGSHKGGRRRPGSKKNSGNKSRKVKRLTQ